MTVEDRKCRKCRFDLCRQAGMKPEFVLDEEQKKLRFRKLIKKKQGLDPEAPDTVTTDNKSSKNTGTELPKKRGRKPKKQILSESKISTVSMNNGNNKPTLEEGFSPMNTDRGSPEAIHIPHCPQSSKSEYLNQATLFADFSQSRCQNVQNLDWEQNIGHVLSKENNDILSKMANELDASTLDALIHTENEIIESDNSQQKCHTPLGEIGDIFAQPGVKQISPVYSHYHQVTMKRTRCDIQLNWASSHQRFRVSQNFIDNLLAFHRGQESLRIPLLKDHIRTLSRLFVDFAFQHDQFHQLSAQDQKKLINRSAPLFVQYILGRYLSASTGQLQIKWILLDNTHHIPPEEVQNLEKISLDVNECLRGLFQTQTDYASYLECVNMMRQAPFAFEGLDVIALAILYCEDNSVFFESPKVIESQKKNVFDLVSWFNRAGFGFHVPSYQEIEAQAKVLEKMVFHFESEKSTSELHKDQRNPNQSMLMPYTLEEEKWLNVQFEKFPRSIIW